MNISNSRGATNGNRHLIVSNIAQQCQCHSTGGRSYASCELRLTIGELHSAVFVYIIGEYYVFSS